MGWAQRRIGLAGRRWRAGADWLPPGAYLWHEMQLTPRNMGLPPAKHFRRPTTLPHGCSGCVHAHGQSPPESRRATMALASSPLSKPLRHPPARGEIRPPPAMTQLPSPRLEKNEQALDPSRTPRRARACASGPFVHFASSPGPWTRIDKTSTVSPHP